MTHLMCGWQENHSQSSFALQTCMHMLQPSGIMASGFCSEQSAKCALKNAADTREQDFL